MKRGTLALIVVGGVIVLALLASRSSGDDPVTRTAKKLGDFIDESWQMIRWGNIGTTAPIPDDVQGGIKRQWDIYLGAPAIGGF